MLVGHYAPALVAHRWAPAAPLWLLLLCAQAVDVGFMVLGLFGIESAALSQNVPRLVVTAGVWTHSIPATVVWAVGCAAVAGWALKDRRSAVAVGLVTASHFVTDLLVHTPDLPIGFVQEPALGLSLWLHPPWAWALECGLLIGATLWTLPVLARTAQRRVVALTAGLLLLQTLSEFVIPTPESFTELAVSALVLYAAVAAVGWWAAPLLLGAVGEGAAVEIKE